MKYIDFDEKDLDKLPEISKKYAHLPSSARAELILKEFFDRYSWETDKYGNRKSASIVDLASYRDRR